jgi:hypothetical protein
VQPTHVSILSDLPPGSSTDKHQILSREPISVVVSCGSLSIASRYLDSVACSRSPFPPDTQTNNPSPPMPYNTRRKSLSLPSLGIQLPHGSRAHPQTPPGSAKGEHPLSKKAKRAHSPLSTVQNAEPTPPLSPPPERVIDYEELNDEIVAGVVRILESTGNRPHTVKELAVVLAPTINIVEQYVTPPSQPCVQNYPRALIRRRCYRTCIADTYFFFPPARPIRMR